MRRFRCELGHVFELDVMPEIISLRHPGCGAASLSFDCEHVHTTGAGVAANGCGALWNCSNCGKVGFDIYDTRNELVRPPHGARLAWLSFEDLNLLADLIGNRLLHNARTMPTLVGQLYPEIMAQQSRHLHELAARLFNRDRRRQVELVEAEAAR